MTAQSLSLLTLFRPVAFRHVRLLRSEAQFHDAPMSSGLAEEPSTARRFLCRAETQPRLVPAARPSSAAQSCRRWTIAPQGHAQLAAASPAPASPPSPVQ